MKTGRPGTEADAVSLPYHTDNATGCPATSANGWFCCRAGGHEGDHAAYSDKVAPRWVWPRAEFEQQSLFSGGRMKLICQSPNHRIPPEQG